MGISLGVLTIFSLISGRSKGRNSFHFTELPCESSVRLITPELRKIKSDNKANVGEFSPDDAVHKLLLGKVVVLENFRSLKDKLLLLDFSVNAHDGNVITAVLIYLKRTLSKELLFRELGCRQTALRHFIRYLTETKELTLLMELLRSLGRTEEVSLLQYKDHLNIADINKRRDFLKSCVSLPFSADDSAHVQHHLALLERQIQIEVSDREAERGGQTDVFQKFPREAPVLHMPLINTLYYSCLYHYTEPQENYSSPLNIRNTFRVSEKQFFITALAARSKLGAWLDVDTMFTNRKWFGFTKKKSPIGFHRVVDILHRSSAPSQVLQKYIGLVDDTERRISLAQRHKCHDVVINTYRELRDRQLLLGYRGRVEPGSEQEVTIDRLLGNTQIRWKN
ncbi:spermatogenesis-defective protein 39 homolog [Gouania willdenowi]|uniref:spermatogenesis-defective protein 39 homolog n=1 Tax=Gouania willdenowi TaxID=441366 RepID=UPI0010566619|nr:spermatogenesis-defective protein 39 homolog [Gouania willdenowi]